MEREVLLEKIRKLKKLFEDGKIPRLHQHEVNPGLEKSSRLNYLYFTLPVAINFQRSSSAMWIAALKTFEDPETNYLFYPEKVIIKPREEIQRDLTKHKLALQKNKHTDIWIKLSQTLNEYYENDPRKIIIENKNDVRKIIETLRITKKKEFPYLSGAKMANYWLYILSQFTDIKLINFNEITIIPDTHIMKSSIRLGITNEKDNRELVAEKWFELLKDTEIVPLEMHPVLWNWSRNGFKPDPRRLGP